VHRAAGRSALKTQSAKERLMEADLRFENAPQSRDVMPRGISTGPLEDLERAATLAGASAIAREAKALAERVRDGLFYVACIGQFKRGKSTLLNALLGEEVVPVGVVPVTAVVTVVRYGERRRARVRLADETQLEISLAELPEYVTEEKNHENAKGVTAVEVFVPSRLLMGGMCFVDTPGIGSVFSGNTEATKAFVPHIDAALVVLGADPPISADELAIGRAHV